MTQINESRYLHQWSKNNCERYTVVNRTCCSDARNYVHSPFKGRGGRGWFGRIRRMYKAKTGQRSAWDWIVRSSFPQAYLTTSHSLFIYITIEYFNSPKYHPNTYILVISLLHKYKCIIIKWKYKEYLGLLKKNESSETTVDRINQSF